MHYNNISNNMAIVYKHTRLDTNKVFYVGIGKTSKRAFSKCDRNKHWKNIVNGCEYRVSILIEDILWEDACELECFLIQEYGRRDLGLGNLVNMTDGGEGANNVSKETKVKISKALKGNSNAFGYKHSDTARIKIKEAHTGVKLSANHVEKIKKALIGNTNNPKKAISQYTKNKVLIKEWDGASTVEKVTGWNQSNITECCKGIRKTAYNCFWEYKI